jgi:hypothetical protein
MVTGQYSRVKQRLYKTQEDTGADFCKKTYDTDVPWPCCVPAFWLDEKWYRALYDWLSRFSRCRDVTVPMKSTLLKWETSSEGLHALGFASDVKTCAYTTCGQRTCWRRTWGNNAWRQKQIGFKQEETKCQYIRFDFVWVGNLQYWLTARTQ